MKDCNGKTISIGDTVKIVNVPEVARKYAQDIIGRHYEVVAAGHTIRLINKKYKEKYRDEIPIQWYLGKNCKIV